MLVKLWNCLGAGTGLEGTDGDTEEVLLFVFLSFKKQTEKTYLNGVGGI